MITYGQRDGSAEEYTGKKRSGNNVLITRYFRDYHSPPCTNVLGAIVAYTAWLCRQYIPSSALVWCICTATVSLKFRWLSFSCCSGLSQLQSSPYHIYISQQRHSWQVTTVHLAKTLAPVMAGAQQSSTQIAPFPAGLIFLDDGWDPARLK